MNTTTAASRLLAVAAFRGGQREAVPGAGATTGTGPSQGEVPMRSRNRVRRNAICAGVAAVVALATPAAASADAVTDWSNHADTAIVKTADQFPAPGHISYAMVQGAVYDAVNAIEASHEPYLPVAPAKAGDSKDAAAATAAYRVLVDLFPEQQSTLQSQYKDSLAAVADGPAKQGGIDAGRRAATAMLTARENDGRNGSITWVPGSEPGEWRPVAPAFMSWLDAWAGEVRPFVVADVEDLRSNGPRKLGGRVYAKEFDEVKTVGSLTSTTRTPDQTDAALFHNDSIDQAARIMRQLSATQGLDSAETARLLAMGHIAMADGVIACFNDKYYWNSWRPITAIREAADDGNPQTHPDPDWQPLLVDFQAGFPEHPSGHACVTSALTHTLKHVFGTDNVAFSAFGTLSRTTRSFTSFSQFRKEVNNARVWGGVHFRTGDDQGSRIGRKVANQLNKNYFQVLP